MIRCPLGHLREDGWRCPRCGAEPDWLHGVPALAPALAGEGFDDALRDALAEAEPESFWFQARNGVITWAIRRWASRAQRVYEVGCGSGYVLAGVREALPRAELWASEIAPGGLRHVRDRVPGAVLFQADARALPFEAHFDLALACDVVEHIDDDAAALAGLRRALRPGGVLLLTVPQHAWMWSAADVDAGHHRRYTVRSLRARVEGAGLEVLHHTGFVSLLLPMMWASRKLRRGEPDVVAELRQPRWLQRTLGAVMGVERAGIRAGLRLPAGGSLLLVARRPAGVRD